MKVLDAGHKYELAHLDGDGCEILTFVKREGEGYVGNIGHYAGTNLQEVIRALIDRVRYVNNQIPHVANDDTLAFLRDALYSLEVRAAERHGRVRPQWSGNFEALATCEKCGHVGCTQTEHSKRG